MKREELDFEIKEHIAVIKTYPSGWTKELNMVSWSGNPAKYDIRDWDTEHEHMSRGITLYPDEMKIVADVLRGRISI